MMILAFALVYLITSRVGDNNKYTNMYNRNVDVHNECVEKPCVVKCCALGQILDESGHCVIGTKLQDLNDISVYLWDNEEKVVNITNLSIGSDFTLLRNEDLFPVPNRNIWTNNFYVLQDGSLKVVSSTGQWIEMARYDFCLDYYISTSYNEEKTETLVFKSSKAGSKESEALFKFELFGAGLAFSCAGMISLVLKISARMRRTLAPILIAFTLTIMAPYILKMTQLANVITGKTSLSDCRIISPALYFFVLSCFFWSNILFYDCWWRIWSFRKSRRNIHQNNNYVRFISYCLFAWGLPFLMTIATIAIDTFDLKKIMPSYYVDQMIKPPFERCFTNDKQNIWYLYVPIMILILADSLLVVMLLYNIYILRKMILKSPSFKNKDIITTKIRIRTFIKLLFCIATIVIVNYIPYMPIVLYYIIAIYSALVTVIFSAIFLANNSIFADLKKRFTEASLKNKHQASEFLEKIAVKLGNTAIIKALPGSDKEDVKILTLENSNEAIV